MATLGIAKLSRLPSLQRRWATQGWRHNCGREEARPTASRWRSVIGRRRHRQTSAPLRSTVGSAPARLFAGGQSANLDCPTGLPYLKNSVIFQYDNDGGGGSDGTRTRDLRRDRPTL